MKEVAIANIMKILRKEYKVNSMPVAELIESQTKDPFKILVATILSARTKDETTREAALRLFSYVDKYSDLSSLSIEEIERMIYPVGFYKNKARFLKELPNVLDKEFGGRIPDTIEGLLMLPGVGRKTANLVVSLGFNKPGICVDTHVHRISNRWGYIRTATPYESEIALRKKLPLIYWKDFNSYLVSFGQNTCRPIGPRCGRCPIIIYCNQIGVSQNRL